MRSQEIRERVAENIIKALESAGDWERPWVELAGSPRNATTGARYRGTNWVNLSVSAWERGYESNYWATFRQWKKVNRVVRKGEKSEVGIFYKTYTKTEEDDDGEEVEKTYRVLKGFSVFNYEQTEPLNDKAWEPPAAEETGDVEDVPEILESIERHKIRVIHGQTEAAYVPMLDEIHMPDPQTFKSHSGYWATLLHEMVHWTKARLDRERSYETEELVAEIGAAMACEMLGIDPEIENSAAYARHWIEKLRENPSYIFAVSSMSEAAVNYLLERD